MKSESGRRMVLEIYIHPLLTLQNSPPLPLPVDLSQFGEYAKKHMTLLEPCFDFQRRLRHKCLGSRFWKRQMKRRKKKFEGKTWTDIYEDLRDVAADEIKRAEDYRKKKKLRR